MKLVFDLQFCEDEIELMMHPRHNTIYGDVDTQIYYIISEHRWKFKW